MSDSLEANAQIVETILESSEGRKLRNTARLITDIIFKVRSSQVFSEIFDEVGTNESTKQVLYRLMADFRLQAESLMGREVKGSDDDLYSQVILPVITHLIDSSA